MRMDAERRHVRLFALEIRDPELYRRYRERMTPMLHARGGSFGFDFSVSEVLKGGGSARINRVFSMRFPDAAGAEAFFADPEYRAVRSELFERAVGHVSKLAEWQE